MRPNKKWEVRRWRQDKRRLRRSWKEGKMGYVDRSDDDTSVHREAKVGNADTGPHLPNPYPGLVRGGYDNCMDTGRQRG